MVLCKWSNAGVGNVATINCTHAPPPPPHTHTHANAVEEATVVLEEMDQVFVSSGEI